MDFSSDRFKALTVSFAFSLWFFIGTLALGVFTFEIFGIFVVSVFIIMQILSIKVSKALNAFSIVNTKIFLGILFIFVISMYGILFKLLRIDLLRLKKQRDSYWLEMEQLKDSRIFKQY